MNASLPLPLLRALARRYPTRDAVLAEIGHLQSVLTLPKGTVHVVSDVHGEDKKLKHIINNASGTLRPLVERLFAGRIDEGELRALLAIIYYPREAYARFQPLKKEDRQAFVLRTIGREVEIIRALSRRHARRHVEKIYPPALASLLRELVANREIADGREAFHAALIEPFVRQDREIELLRAVAHVIRNLSVEEIVVAGDLGDRGPRIDKVIDFLMRQPNVTIVWGNHDASWMGACLGQEALIATVVRLSLRYRRLAQLEEGYGIPLAPVERLARTAYADDPAERFAVKGDGVEDPLLLARMQKAAAILQFKLEGQLLRRHPEWDLEHRCLLHRINPAAGTVTIDGVTYPLLDNHFPTIDWKDPYALSADEKECLERLRHSFLESPVLWNQMTWVERRGQMVIRRDLAVIFHGCVPVDARGDFESFPVDGEPVAGRALFEALGRKVRGAFRERTRDQLDLLWYLWSGPRSPLFGKDRMATFEVYFVADEHAHHETKNPYFSLIHDPAFCAKICREFDVDEKRGLIVNGHVPVKIEKGESPVKRSGRAVTIDGAFSEAYGDKGYTLVLDAERTSLAQHHHFESVEDAVISGADILPIVTEIERFDPPRTIGDTEVGEELRKEIEVLWDLLGAYESSAVQERVG
jgi:fructose-1,6-bisphosphatase III